MDCVPRVTVLTHVIVILAILVQHVTSVSNVKLCVVKPGSMGVGVLIIF